MRSVLSLALGLLVIRTFFPELGSELETTLLSLLRFMTEAFSSTNAFV